MWSSNHLQKRIQEPEIMDEDDLAPDKLHTALRGLDRVGFVSFATATVWRPIQELAQQDPSKTLRVLDIGTGSGRIPIVMSKWARRAGISLELAGCDINRNAITFAEQRAKTKNAPVHFFYRDVLQEGLSEEYDVIMCTLLLHHLDDRNVVALLQEMVRAGKKLILANDLIRCRMGWQLAWLGTRLLMVDQINRIDGLRSVAAAFTIEEITKLAAQANLPASLRIEKRFPFRFLLSVTKS